MAGLRQYYLSRLRSHLHFHLFFLIIDYLKRLKLSKSIHSLLDNFCANDATLCFPFQYMCTGLVSSYSFINYFLSRDERVLKICRGPVHGPSHVRVYTVNPGGISSWFAFWTSRSVTSARDGD